ncbi:uncharacterized protein EV154DRAFT_506776 [Mucor mucedo]|uniref:uncharacterized protein n=1 Tax=Mucor mucedo TaxID=29922 RepID=UPI00221E716C|nr:uncharacterized protein EV154DRAFT_506776 [Mucor mucedo]KAI7891881.1 hypothetical protein EV154DRAFT_506776 [Mucor mucedo]
MSPTAAVAQPIIDQVSFNTDTTSNVYPDRIIGPTTWDGKDLKAHPEKWIYHLTPEDITDIDQAIKHFVSLDIPFSQISPSTFPLTTFQNVIIKERNNLFQGLGVGLIRGFPIEKYERKEQVAMFMGIGSYFGTFKPQNRKGHILGHIKDLTEGSTTKVVYSADDPTTRIYATRKAQPFHTDSTDIVSLLCLNEGQEGGLSSVISSHTLYNRLRELRPDIVELMKGRWLWDHKGEHDPSDAPYTTIQPMQYYENHLFTFWGPHFFETVSRFPGVVVEEKYLEAIRYIQDLCEREALYMKLQTGDIQLVNNHALLHARGAYKDIPGQTRHLLRLWFLVDEEVSGWKWPPNKKEYTHEYVKEQVVPLEAE